uniref:Uncharacterized protein n=1 Tax=Arundo donax TaxID=35708 RepID=A0A0A9GKC6_ARUDO
MQVFFTFIAPTLQCANI